ncbi:ferredoxin [Yoonia sp. 2307UL14-13]|uniref:ferredoxin n=1 Tax=Yoonia sp. 2307UL14-13 TaxID=3126506 RepID=UPI0030B53C02
MDWRAQLDPHGLRVLGECTDGDDALTLIGPDEPAFWPIFRGSPEYAESAPDPLDRWSARVLGAVADTVGGTPIFPFGGPPYAPFQRWAVATGRAWPSPIGFLVHEEIGMFASYRGAIRHRGSAKIGTGDRPCDTCTGQPCLSACPVDAFADGYDVDRCKAHLHSREGRTCRMRGCLARHACPIGQGRRLPAQAAFHMEAFL